MADWTREDEQLHVRDIVQHKRTGMVGTVTGFASRTLHPDSDGTDVMVDHTGPYPQADFDRLRKEGPDDRKRAGEDSD